MTARKEQQRCCACKRNIISEPELKLYVWAVHSRICKECAEEHLTAEAYKEMTGEISKRKKKNSNQKMI